MRTSDQFIDCYNKIDQQLTGMAHLDFDAPFSQKVIALSALNCVIHRYKDELLTYGKLRNAIVHNPRIGNDPIAEPHMDTLSRLEKIYQEITNPLKVYPKFKVDVLGAKSEDYINEIIVEMERRSFSQFPVFENNKVVEIITTNTISRWLSKKVEENGTIMIDEVRIRDLVTCIEFKLNYKFISRDTNVYEAYNYFVKNIKEKNRNIDALFITDHGRSNEKLLGLITIEDIAPYGLS